MIVLLHKTRPSVVGMQVHWHVSIFICGFVDCYFCMCFSSTFKHLNHPTCILFMCTLGGWLIFLLLVLFTYLVCRDFYQKILIRRVFYWQMTILNIYSRRFFFFFFDENIFNSWRYCESSHEWPPLEPMAKMLTYGLSFLYLSCLIFMSSHSF